MVEKITTRSGDATTTELSGGAEFGISNVFNLFKVALGGSATKAKGEQPRKNIMRSDIIPTVPC